MGLPIFRNETVVKRGEYIEKWMGGFRKPAWSFSKRHFAVCIYKPDRIGDFVLALGAIRKIVDRFGEKNCVLVISPLVKELADLEFPDSPKVEVNSFENPCRLNVFFQFLRCRRRLGGMVFDRMVCLRHQRVRMQNLLLSCIRAKESFGLINQKPYHLGDQREFSFSHSSPYPSQQVHGLCLEMEAHRIVVQQTIETKVDSAHIYPSFRRLQANPQEYVLVSPFASMPIRDYPENALVSVLVAIHHTHPFPVRISFSTQQRERAERLFKMLHLEGVPVEPLQSTSIHEYLVMVSRAKCVLTVESATAHVATTLNIPTVVWIGGGHYRQYGPWSLSSRQQWVTHPVSCTGCNWNCIETEPYCITKIEVEDVVRAFRTVIDL